MPRSNVQCAVIVLSVVTTVSMACSRADVKPPPDARQADEQAIRESEADWAKAWAAKDLERIVSHYANDALVEFAGLPIQSGRETIRAGVKRAIANPDFALSFAPAQVEVSKGGDLAYARGVYTTALTNVGARQLVTTVKGKYIVIYRKQPDGRWLAIHDINNRDG